MSFLLMCLSASAQEPTPVEAAPPVEAPAPPPPVDPAVVHEELRAVRDRVSKAMASRDVPALLETLHPDVVFTTTDGVAVRGRAGVEGYVKKMLEGPDAAVKSFSYDVTSDDLSLLYGGDTAIAWGPSHDHYELTTGQSFDLDTRWSATLVKTDGQWLIASVHSSVDVFDNAALDAAVAWVPKAASGAGVLGLVLGLLGGFFVGRRAR